MQQNSLILSMVTKLGTNVQKNITMLDLGCGKGDSVLEFQKEGFHGVFGTDFSDSWNTRENKDLQKSCFVIQQNPYRLPFCDDTFDVVYSNSVLEHVNDYTSTLREIHRVMKPHGISIHFFPSKWYCIREPHMHIPFGSFVMFRLWYMFWAFVGVRNEFQKSLQWKEVYEKNFQYRKECLNYLPKHTISKIAKNEFDRISYPTREYFNLAQGKAGRLFRKMPLPGLDRIMSFFHNRVLVTYK
jgi:ubiquinone/menaquinone biosynthesis C-methylase UbiE